ncbi:hypothetical protein NL465_29760, partial [Klebsiella pneumoniae]|nr:hypothetical protein [Klebsiella pneumoniae]
PTVMVPVAKPPPVVPVPKFTASTVAEVLSVVVETIGPVVSAAVSFHVEDPVVFQVPPAVPKPAVAAVFWSQ